MRAVILAAGLGARLASFTEDRPKSLVPLFGRPILTESIDVLRKSGVTDITILAGYRHEMIAAAAPGCNILVNHEYATTNMVGTLFHDLTLFADNRNDLLVIYGDILYEPRVLAALMQCNAPIALAVNTEWRRLWELRMPDPLSDAETLKIGADSQLVEIGKKPRSYDDIQGQYMGLFKIAADHMHPIAKAYQSLDRDAIYDGQPFRSMYMTSFLQHLIDQGWRIQSISIPGGWLEVDTVEDLTLYEKMHSDGTLGSVFLRTGK